MKREHAMYYSESRGRKHRAGINFKKVQSEDKVTDLREKKNKLRGIRQTKRKHGKEKKERNRALDW